MKKIFVLTLLILTFMSHTSYVYADSVSYTVTVANTDGTFAKNSVTYPTYKEAYAVFSQAENRDTVILGLNNKVYAIKAGMVITDSSSSTLVYSSYYPGGIAAYVSNYYVGYFNNVDASMMVSFTLSDFTGSASVNEVILIPANHIFPLATGTNSDRYEFDYYTKNSSGNLVHYLSTYSSSNKNTNFSAILVDKAPEFMAEGVRYYSTDSFHYYTDPYAAIENNAAVDSYAGFHCIYYKYLSFRSKTSYSETQLNAYIAYRNSTYSTSLQCAYLNLGSAFVTAQNLYGINAAMEIAFANHESGYGKSYYARTRNNVFGINAVDSNPDNANYYTSTAECIRQHAYYTLSQGYFDAKTDSRYFGSFSGSKGGGVNVKYASDPWHGEKIASHTFQLDSYLGFSDYGKYTIGITIGATKAYASDSTSSTVLYEYTAGKSSYATLSGMSVVVLGEVGDFYIVQSDMPLTEDRTADYSIEYDYIKSIVYIPKTQLNLVYISSSYNSNPDENDDDPTESDTCIRLYSNSSVTDFILANTDDNGYVLVYDGTNPVTTGLMKTGFVVQSYQTDDTFIENLDVAIYADLDADGEVTTTDLVILRRYLANLSELEGARGIAVDINKDGNKDTTDLVLLRRYLAGLIDIKEQ